jgi:hypothetical protein
MGLKMPEERSLDDIYLGDFGIRANLIFQSCLDVLTAGVMDFDFSEDINELARMNRQLSGNSKQHCLDITQYLQIRSRIGWMRVHLISLQSDLKPAINNLNV